MHCEKKRMLLINIQKLNPQCAQAFHTYNSFKQKNKIKIPFSLNPPKIRPQTCRYIQALKHPGFNLVKKIVQENNQSNQKDTTVSQNILKDQDNTNLDNSRKSFDCGRKILQEIDESWQKKILPKSKTFRPIFSSYKKKFLDLSTLEKSQEELNPQNQLLLNKNQIQQSQKQNDQGKENAQYPQTKERSRVFTSQTSRSEVFSTRQNKFIIRNSQSWKLYNLNLSGSCTPRYKQKIDNIINKCQDITWNQNCKDLIIRSEEKQDNINSKLVKLKKKIKNKLEANTHDGLINKNRKNRLFMQQTDLTIMPEKKLKKFLVEMKKSIKKIKLTH